MPLKVCRREIDAAQDLCLLYPRIVLDQIGENLDNFGDHSGSPFENLDITELKDVVLTAHTMYFR